MFKLLNLRQNAGIIGPLLGVGILLVTSLVLVVQMTIRPWATPDYGSETHLNTSTDLEGYTRTKLTYLGETSEGPLGWTPSESARAAADEGYAAFVGYGCAGCHGLDATGTTAGPSVAGSSARRIGNLTRKGPKTMPAFSEDHLMGEDLDLIAAFLESRTEATPTPEPVVRIAATPFPMPTATPNPVAVPTATVGPVNTPDPDAAPTAVPEATATPAAVDVRELRAAQILFFDVGCDICHGESAEGGPDGPAIEDMTAEEIRDVVRDPQRPEDSSYSESMDPYDLASLSEAELDEIIFFLLNRE